MNFRDGFTLVEIMITMVIMTILMAVGTISVTGLQGQARDKERQSDIDSIARGLEIRYKRDNPVITSTVPANIVQRGTYPGLREMLHANGNTINGPGTTYDPSYTPSSVSGGYMTEELPGITKSSLAPPSSDGYFGLVCLSSCAAAGSSTQLQSAFNKSGTIYKDAYIYEPADKDGNICWDNTCVQYNLYWISETDKTPYLGIPGLKVLKSKYR